MELDFPMMTHEKKVKKEKPGLFCRHEFFIVYQNALHFVFDDLLLNCIIFK